MTNEIAVIEYREAIAELKAQNAELSMQLQHTSMQLQSLQAEKASKLEDSLYSPALSQHYQGIAQTLAKSTIIPKAYIGKPQDIFVAMAMGYQLGLPVEQALQDIAVINGKPCLYGDGMMAVCISHPECESIIEEPLVDANGLVYGYECTVKRKGHSPHTKRFTLEDAHRAGLNNRGNVWGSYSERMLQMRARSYALRDKFADALRGIKMAETEAENVVEGDAVEVLSRTEQLKELLTAQETRDEKDHQSNSYREPQAQNKKDSAQPEENVHDERMDEVGNAENEMLGEGEDTDPISPELVEYIEKLFILKNFDAERKKKALDYYHVDSVDKMLNLEGRELVKQLGKV